MTILSFGVFVRPLQQEFGWTVGQTTFAAMIISYMIMFVAPFQGILTDRYGGRAVVYRLYSDFCDRLRATLFFAEQLVRLLRALGFDTYLRRGRVAAFLPARNSYVV